jgi:hypothetical protein
MRDLNYRKSTSLSVLSLGTDKSLSGDHMMVLQLSSSYKSDRAQFPCSDHSRHEMVAEESDSFLRETVEADILELRRLPAKRLQ